MRRAHAMSLSVPQTLALTDAEIAFLRAFEFSLDPANPTMGNAARVIGYGEVSCALVLAEMPGLVCKRMTGFANANEANRYSASVDDYLRELAAHDVAVAQTRLAMIAGPDEKAVAYLVQPLLAESGLASNLLHKASEDRLVACLCAVLRTAQRLLQANEVRTDGRKVTLDAQLSNWWFEAGSPDPVLLDVGTPFMRRHGVDECGTGFFLAPVPAVLRWYYRRQRAVEKYIDDYFDPRALAMDILGNFHKEGRGDRIAPVLSTVNDWLDGMGSYTPISTGDVDAYYQKDAADLELYLRVRRIDRWVRSSLMRRRYPFVLPGPIQR